MSVDEVLKVIEKRLLSRQLNPVERLILRQSWLGQKYSEMAQNTAYGCDYLKEVGSQLWHELSAVVGEKVTKKNLHLILGQYLQEGNHYQTQEPQPFIKAELATSPAIAVLNRQFPGDTVPIPSPFYIERPPVEELAYAQINKPGCVIRVQAPSKMGKSSLLSRIMARATALGYKTALLNIQEADEAVFIALDPFLRWFCANISRLLNLAPKLDDYWDEEMGSKVSCKLYFEAYLLKQINCPLVIALSEVDRLFEHRAIAKDFLPMLRLWHEQARSSEAWQELRLVVVHSTEIYVPLKIHQSPFNVGLAIKLPPFSPEQVQELARRYNLDWSSSEVEQLMAMVGGHPYLVSVALYYLSRKETTLPELLQTAPTASGIYSHHLRTHAAMLQNEPQLAYALYQVVSVNEIALEAIAAYKLESMGLVHLKGNCAKPSCELYRLYFREQFKPRKHLQVQQWHNQDSEYQSVRSVDELTELPNREYFDWYLATEWQHHARETVSLSLILGDVDYFRFYNDAYGHSIGDACLQLIASAIRDFVGRFEAVAARYGGEEFAVILPHSDRHTAVRVAETIRNSVKALSIPHNQSRVVKLPEQVVTLSLGVATTTPSLQATPTMLVAAAQEALSLSKKQGRDCVTLSSTLE